MSDRDMEDLIAIVEAALGKDWRAVIEHMRDMNSLDDIAERIAAGDREGVLEEVRAAAEQFATGVHGGYVQGAEAATEYVSGRVDTDVAYDAKNHRAVAWAKENVADKVTSIGEDTRDMVRQVVTDGIERGANPREVARELRDSIGLNADRVSAVNSYRDALESGDYTNALGRELRDGRYDRTITAAIRDQTEIPADRIDAMVDRYRANQVASRADLIAHHEAMGAVHAGARQGFQQAIDDGHIDEDQLLREWHWSPSGHPRPSHRAMRGQKRPFGEPYETGDGVELMYPHDPNAPIEETAGCHCTESTRLAL